MDIEILAFGIARDIVGGHSVNLNLEDTATVETLKKKLFQEFPEFRRLASLSIAVNATYANDSQVLSASDEVVLIPPVSGG